MMAHSLGVRGKGYPVEFDHRPPMKLNFVERAKHGRQIDSSASQLHPLERVFHLRRHRHIDYVLQMQKQNAVAVALDRLGWIAAPAT